MALLGQAASSTLGGGVLLTGWNDQNWRPFSTSIVFFVTVTEPSRGSGAPDAIHFSKSAITAALSFCFGGILRASSTCLSALRSRLLFTSPGTTAGPLSPPLRMPLRVSRIRPPRIFLAVVAWQE